ncbi:MAG: 7TM-DISM domain-containing protein [Planctomycetaceae bacterium]
MGSDHYSVSLYFAFRQRLCLSVSLVCCFFACTGCDFVLRSDGAADSVLKVDRKQFLEDPGGTVTLDQMLKTELPRQAFTATDSVVSWGFTQSVIWGRFDLSSLRRTEAIVEIPSTRLDQVDWFEVRGGTLVRKETGGLRAGAGMAPMHYPSLQVNVTPSAPVTVLCRIQSDGSLTIPLVIATTEEYRRMDVTRRYFSYVQIGGFAVVVLIVLMLALMFSDWSYGLLAMSCACVLLYGLLFDNVLSLPGLLLPASWIRAGSSLTTITAGIFLLSFSVVYSELFALSRMDRMIFFCSLLLALCFFGAHFLLPFPLINKSLSVVQTVVSLATLWLTSSRWRRHRRREDRVLFATLLLCHAPVLVLVLQLGGWISIGLTPSSLRFMAMPVIFFSLFVALMQRRQLIERLKLHAALARAGEAEARLLVLRYQLNPHMLMNSLSAVSWLSSESPEKIPGFIENLSAILQNRLRPSTGQLWTVAKEVELAQNLLELAAVRFGDQIEHTILMSPAAEACLLPEMLAQPLVENAIKYCPPDLPSASIRVVAEIQQNHLVIKVQNSIKPGTTGTVADGLKIGHANIRQRLEICYGERAKFRFQTTDTLAVATLELPILTSDKCS